MTDTDYKRLWRKEVAKNIALANKVGVYQQVVNGANEEINRLRLKCGEPLVDTKKFEVTESGVAIK